MVRDQPFTERLKPAAGASPRLDPHNAVVVAPLSVIELREPEFLQMLIYWHECRKDRAMPARNDIKLERIYRIMNKVLIIAVMPSAPFFRFNLVGTQIADWAHFDASGRGIDEIEATSYRNMLFATYSEVRGARRPIAHRIRWDEPNGVHRYKRVLLPLSEDGENVNMILSCSVVEEYRAVEAYWSNPGPAAVQY